MSERRDRIMARKDLVIQMLTFLPPLKIIHPHLVGWMTLLIKMMKNRFIPPFLSPSQNVSSSSNVVSRVRQNPPHESPHLNTYLFETINLQAQQRDAHWEGLRSIGKALKDMMSGKRK
ncbi:hypothetical protein Tco_1438722 [Tanacetum coccineum]